MFLAAALTVTMRAFARMATVVDYDCIVIGAGISGLCSASYLVKHGISVVVFEANDRCGGRTFTTSVDGASVDLGGIRALTKPLN